MTGSDSRGCSVSPAHWQAELRGPVEWVHPAGLVLCLPWPPKKKGLSGGGSSLSLLRCQTEGTQGESMTVSALPQILRIGQKKNASSIVVSRLAAERRNWKPPPLRADQLSALSRINRQTRKGSHRLEEMERERACNSRPLQASLIQQTRRLAVSVLRCCASLLPVLMPAPALAVGQCPRSSTGTVWTSPLALPPLTKVALPLAVALV